MPTVIRDRRSSIFVAASKPDEKRSGETIHKKRLNTLALFLYVLTMVVGFVLAITEFDNLYLFVTGFLLFVANMILFYVALVDRENMNKK